MDELLKQCKQEGWSFISACNLLLECASDVDNDKRHLRLNGKRRKAWRTPRVRFLKLNSKFCIICLKQLFFSSNATFEKEFSRCCNQYPKLEMYIAWIGNPKAVIPFEHLYNVSETTAVVGVAFCQTHPDGIQMLMNLCTDLRIAKEQVLYHPKVYIFSNKKQKAVFIGSSNFTYNGFYENHEANILIEGVDNEKVFTAIETDVKKWKDNDHSFKPGDNWLKNYAERYAKRRDKIKKAGLDDEAEKEEETVFIRKVSKKGRTRYEE